MNNVSKIVLKQEDTIIYRLSADVVFMLASMVVVQLAVNFRSIDALGVFFSSRWLHKPIDLLMTVENPMTCPAVGE